MKQEYEETPFARAAQSFSAALPRRVEATDEDLRKIVLPGWRYDEIANAVLAMYEKVDAHVMPLPVFDIANALGYSPIPYRAYGARFHEVFLAAKCGCVYNAVPRIVQISDSLQRPPDRYADKLQHHA